MHKYIHTFISSADADLSATATRCCDASSLTFLISDSNVFKRCPRSETIESICYMYVSVYVCMYACMHVCMYAISDSNVFRKTSSLGCRGIYLYMYVSVYVCMYVLHICNVMYMCVCMCVCMYVCMNVCMYECMQVRFHEFIYACMHACMWVCMCVNVFWLYFYLFFTLALTSIFAHFKLHIHASSPVCTYMYTIHCASIQTTLYADTQFHASAHITCFCSSWILTVLREHSSSSCTDATLTCSPPPLSWADNFMLECVL
jgi:hypothetical protein